MPGCGRGMGGAPRAGLSPTGVEPAQGRLNSAGSALSLKVTWALVGGELCTRRDLTHSVSSLKGTQKTFPVNPGGLVLLTRPHSLPCVLAICVHGPWRLCSPTPLCLSPPFPERAGEWLGLQPAHLMLRADESEAHTCRGLSKGRTPAQPNRAQRSEGLSSGPWGQDQRTGREGFMGTELQVGEMESSRDDVGDVAQHVNVFNAPELYTEKWRKYKFYIHFATIKKTFFI